MSNVFKTLKSVFKTILVILALSGTAQALSRFLK
jgi:hypothetical protein